MKCFFLLAELLCICLCAQLICSYVFMPVAFMMGVPYDESFTVAELIGIKLFLNEFVAYEKLSELKVNRLSGLEEIIGGQRQWISVSRSATSFSCKTRCHRNDFENAQTSYLVCNSCSRCAQRLSPLLLFVALPTSVRLEL